jgi:electron transfer flavoprotein beta subunit
MEVEIQEHAVRVKRELEDGWFQWLELPFPALLTIQSGIGKLRYATLMGIKKAKTKEVRQVSAASSAVAPSVTLDRVYVPEKRKQTRLIDGSPENIAAELLEVLRSEVRAL